MPNPRIIAGKARGMRLFPVPGDSTRPITDRVKENLFNIIGPDIVDADFLDLFGGTGSVGIEALSRGARFCRFIEKNANAFKALKKNLDYTKVVNEAELLQSDAFQQLKRRPDRQFDYIYIAPPQYKGMWKQALLDLDQNPGWMAEYAWVIVQIHPIEFEELGDFKHFEEFDQRKYGSTLLVFYEAKE
ncbi:MAG: 16S rRNA (guanine(966)-N(2))-methyltransferase RsmD [Anaerolineaceae bacterium]|nr:16S rRNA (guanine(966)-N(2))-methyltransferase RsmD [Anaerolineaceae bacterium]